MNLNNVREGELADVFNILEEVFRVLEIDYYLIGAIARDIWYARGEKHFRSTKDIDFAVLVGSQKEYDAVRQYLIENKKFVDIRQNSFVLISPSGIQVDILPFGEITIDDGIKITGTGLTNIRVNGFMEVYKSGTAMVDLTTGHHFKVASLPSIVLLKLIAFDDRPEERLKDARDIANILVNYFELQADVVYEDHADIFTVSDSELDKLTFPVVSGIVIGREMKRITDGNQLLKERLVKILETQMALAENSAFIRNMVEETGANVEEIIRWLNALHTGLY
jgi:predicted nucleotidyltransferase